MPFRVIQGHIFGTLPVERVYATACVNNCNLPSSIWHRFQLRIVGQGVSLFNTLVGLSRYIHYGKIWPQESQIHPPVEQCKAYFDILNHLGITHDCDGQTDGRTDSLIANASLRCVANKNEIVDILGLFPVGSSLDYYNLYVIFVVFHFNIAHMAVSRLCLITVIQ